MRMHVSRLFTPILLAILYMGFVEYAMADDHQGDNQYFELRQYRLKSADAANKVDTYLTQSLVPALTRLGTGPVGVFRESIEQDQPLRFVLIPHDSLNAFAGIAGKLAVDQEYQANAADYLQTPVDAAPLTRIRSELLYAFNCWPQLKVPQLTLDKHDRIFELRVYESPTEHFGELKIEMFNAGEVPIFLDSGIVPVFMGQSLVGDLMPNLTYMTVYANEEEKSKAWDNFRMNPDWKVLSGNERYQGSVSKIHKFDLLPVPGSQL